MEVRVSSTCLASRRSVSCSSSRACGRVSKKPTWIASGGHGNAPRGASSTRLGQGAADGWSTQPAAGVTGMRGVGMPVGGLPRLARGMSG
eukprot:scaffold79446_cov33-Tisochrysis_lutea.AAC.1